MAGSNITPQPSVNAPFVDTNGKIVTAWLEWLRSQLTQIATGITGSGTAGALVRWTGTSSVGPANLSGDVTTSGGTATTLAASGVTAGTYGDATHVARVTVDAKGRTTAASNVAIAASVTPPGGANTDIQYNDGGAFGGDANLTWDKTVQQARVGATDNNSGLIVVDSGVIAIGGEELRIGSQVVAGVEIAEAVDQGYLFVGGAPQIGMGLSTGETPGSPTVYAQWQELDLTADYRATVNGDDTAGAVPGKAIGATRNAGGGGAASTLFGQLKDGRFFVFWVDATGAPRYNVGASLASLRPTESGSVSDTSGNLFGSGTGLSMATVCAIASLRA